MNRREFLRRLVVSSVLIGISIVGIDEMATLAMRGQTTNPPQALVLTSVQQTSGSGTIESATVNTTQLQSTSVAPTGYALVASLSALNGKTYAYFTHPTAGSAIILNASGQWKVFSATCTHRPCTVNYSGSNIFCPCHGGAFSTANGAVLGGPPPRPLPEYAVQIIGGNVYASLSRIN